MKLTGCAFALFLACAVVFAGGSAEESSSGRVQTVAASGAILKSSEVKIDSLLGAVNQRYPEPEGSIGILARAGHYQISNRGQTELLLVGVQAKRLSFDELPPMNIAFVIDKSGSMADAGKMEWVKQSFEVFIAKVRPKDFVSLVLFGTNAEVAFPSTQMSVAGARDKLRGIVQAATPGGGTNLKAGMEQGYQQVMSNFRGEYINRVILLTDGRADTAGLLDMAGSYREVGIGISAVGLGLDFDQELIRSLALRGGGSSRFIGDRATMVEAFGDGLPRMVAALASDLVLDVALDAGVAVRNVWAYDAKTTGSTVRITFPSVHVGDYESVMMQLELKKTAAAGEVTLARVTGTYKDWSGKQVKVEPIEVKALIVDDPKPVDGYSDPYVLRAGTALDFGLALQEIGDRYAEVQKLSSGDAKRTELMDGLIARTKRMREEAANAALRLETEQFDSYVKTADLYLRTFGQALAWTAKQVDEYIAVPAMDAGPAKPRFVDEADALFREIRAETGTGAAAGAKGRLAVAGFTAKDAAGAPMLELLDRTAESALVGMPGLTLIERKDLDKVLKEQELAVSDLMATESAIKVGQILSATHILTGTVIPMKDSVVIFARVVSVESGAIESVAQVVVPRTPEVEDLLRTGR
jgi:hypothetical protein